MTGKSEILVALEGLARNLEQSAVWLGKNDVIASAHLRQASQCVTMLVEVIDPHPLPLPENEMEIHADVA